MSSVSYDVFLPEIIPYVRDVPEVVAFNAVRNACIEFCEKTMYLQVDLDPIALTADVAEYDLDSATGYKVVNIAEVWNGDQFLVPKSVEELTRIYRATDWRTTKGNPYYFFRPTASVMRLVPMPSVATTGSLNIKAVVAPSRASTTVDTDIFERFLEAISFGARARLYDMANQPFYDPKSAQVYLKRFTDAINDVRRRVNKGDVRAASQIEFQRWI